MVGYILGLGDRHLSNIMLDQLSGHVLHIDFGDCFEVAIHRDAFPETVPFRLTRMLVRAMGVSRIEGNFRTTCEAVMGVLRTHECSVMAVFEAFIHDPLLNWQLVADGEKKEQKPANRIAGRVEKTTKAIAAFHAQAKARIDRTETDMLPEQRKQTSREAQPDEILLNERALEVTRRIMSKLTGNDFQPMRLRSKFGARITGTPVRASPAGPTVVYATLDVSTQVSRLISEAQSHSNLCQLYKGWSPYW